MAASIERGSFAGHETFPFRYTWMRKAVDLIGRDPEGFTRDDAMVNLGVGKNMVRSIRHWALVAGILEEDPSVRNNRGSVLRATALGSKLLREDGWDPFMEDAATIWLLHWQIASTPDNATTWYWVFNHLPQPEFSRSDLQRLLQHVVEQGGWSRVSPASLKRDIDCFLRTYVAGRAARGDVLEDTLECPLIELGLIRELGERGTFSLDRGEHPTLPDEVFAYALMQYVQRRADSTVKTIPLEAIAYAPGAPGRVFCLTEEALLLRLERISDLTNGNLSFDETAGLRQLLIREVHGDADAVLAAYYDRKPGARRS